MSRMEELETENAVLKERLYTLHAIGTPEIQDAMKHHVDMANLDQYSERAALRGQIHQEREKSQELENKVKDLENEIRELRSKHEDPG